MARVDEQVRYVIANALLRGGPDPDYADGDDSTWMEVDWPSLTREVLVDGRPVNLIDTGGDGPPLLFIHGWSALWQSWLLNIPAFMDTHRVIAIDLPGFGQSAMPAGKISIQGYARAVDEVCHALHVDCPVVVGNSMGGFVGAELAISFPTRVRKLVLVAAAGLSIEYQRREPLMTASRVWGAIAARSVARAELIVRRPRIRRAAMQTVVRYPERLSGPLTWELVQGAGKPGFIPALEALLSYSFRDRLPDIEVPVLIVWGRGDLMVPVGDAARFERLIGENARAVLFGDTGHMPMLERPTRFNALLREFLAEEPASEPISEPEPAPEPEPAR